MTRPRGRPRKAKTQTREERLAYLSAYYKRPEQRAKRREYERAKRAAETPEERAERRAYESARRREYEARRRATETPEERAERLKKRRAYAARRRAEKAPRAGSPPNPREVSGR
jgi:hypothetical protein